jgi:hypothetical protein
MIAIELSLSQLKDAIKQLSPTERLELNEVIWTDDTAIPTEHQELVKARIKASKANPKELLDWEVALKTLHF